MTALLGHATPVWSVTTTTTSLLRPWPSGTRNVIAWNAGVPAGKPGGNGTTSVSSGTSSGVRPPKDTRTVAVGSDSPKLTPKMVMRVPPLVGAVNELRPPTESMVARPYDVVATLRSLAWSFTVICQWWSSPTPGMVVQRTSSWSTTMQSLAVYSRPEGPYVTPSR